MLFPRVIRDDLTWPEIYTYRVTPADFGWVDTTPVGFLFDEKDIRVIDSTKNIAYKTLAKKATKETPKSPRKSVKASAVPKAKKK